MSSSYKSSVKEMRKEKRKARHPTNVRRCDQGNPLTLDTFNKTTIESTVDGYTKLKVTKPPSNPKCSDCGTDLTGKPIRWVKKEEREIPYCRSCFLTRFGKSRLQEDA